MNQEYKKWFNKAENDLQNIVNNLTSEIIPCDTVCFHSQQVAEKYLKGYLTGQNVLIEKTHNLLILLEMSKKIDISFEQIKSELITLNDYAVTSRYPDFINELTIDDANEAYQCALKVKEFILIKIKTK